MPPKVVVLSEEKLTEAIINLGFQENLDMDMEIINALFEDAVSIAQEYERKGNVDIFVSGGANAALMEKVLDTPVVTIRVSGFDVLKALREAKQYSSEIVIFNYANKISELDTVGEILNVTVEQHVYFDKKDLERKLVMLKNKGVKIVVGASLVNRIAGELGLKSIFVYSNESIGRALEEAVRLAESRKREFLKNQQFEAILDLTDTGVVVMGHEGQVNLVNRAAEKILQIDMYSSVGESIENIIPNAKTLDIIKTGKAQSGQLLKTDNAHIVTNYLPLIIREKVEGFVASFHDIKHIQQVEEKIRKKLHENGLYAKHTFEDLVSYSQTMSSQVELAQQYGLTDSTILMIGESGTGKELFANSIHNISLRKHSPFVAINCAALPDNLLESELFGYEDGAFTGAKKGGKPGLFELAHGGTIFLDEIGDISLSLQTRLLRVLQEREVMRIGSDKIIPIDLRVLCATNKDLYQMVLEGTFRKDLYYRINVLRLDIPPLRDRPDDIFPLIDRFIQKYPTREIVKPLFSEMEKEFRAYSWPGNVRELENVVERCVAMFYILDQAAIKDHILKYFMLHHVSVKSNDLVKEELLDVNYTSIRKIRDSEILDVLRKVEGNKTLAAEKLGMSRATLWRRLKRIEDPV